MNTYKFDFERYFMIKTILLWRWITLNYCRDELPTKTKNGHVSFFQKQSPHNYVKSFVSTDDSQTREKISENSSSSECKISHLAAILADYYQMFSVAHRYEYLIVFFAFCFLYRFQHNFINKPFSN